MKIVVTGGAGFIGSHFIRELLTDRDSKYQVSVIDLLTYAGNMKNIAEFKDMPNFEFFEGDIGDSDLSTDIFLNATAIVNFAAESHVDRSIISSTAFIETNVNGTHNLLNKAIEFGVQRFIQISTDEVYGSISEGAWDENSQLLPNSPYAASKAAGDLLVRAFNKTHGLHTNVTRCSNNFGTHQFPEKLIPVIINSIMTGKKIPIYGDGANRRDWLHVSDHCRAIKEVMLNGGYGEIYNIGGGTELSNLALVSTLISIMGASHDSISYAPDRKGHDARYSVNYNKIHLELGYAPKKQLEGSLRETVDWYLKNPNWWN